MVALVFPDRDVLSDLLLEIFADGLGDTSALRFAGLEEDDCQVGGLAIDRRHAVQADRFEDSREMGVAETETEAVHFDGVLSTALGRVDLGVLSCPTMGAVIWKMTSG